MSFEQKPESSEQKEGLNISLDALKKIIDLNIEGLSDTALHNSQIVSSKEWEEKLDDVEEFIPGVKGDPSLGVGVKTDLARTLFPELRNERVKFGSNQELMSRDKKVELLKKYFKDKIMVDIGAGAWGYEDGYSIAKLLECRLYIAVEAYHAKELANHIFSRLETEIQKSTTPYVVIEEDMQSFLQRLPDNSVSILASGIDPVILPAAAIRDQVSKEMKRVLNPEGAVLDIECDRELDFENNKLVAEFSNGSRILIKD